MAVTSKDLVQLIGQTSVSVLGSEVKENEKGETVVAVVNKATNQSLLEVPVREGCCKRRLTGPPCKLRRLLPIDGEEVRISVCNCPFAVDLRQQEDSASQ